MCTFHEDQYTFFYLISLNFSRMKNVEDKSFRENQNTYFMFSNFFFFENLALYEIKCKKFVETYRPHMRVWRMRVAFWIPKATNTQSVCVIPIASRLVQWFTQVRLCITL